MWAAYSTRDAAEFVGLSESAVRSCVRAGLITRDTSRLRFSFRDLLVLKMIKGLLGNGLTLRRARRELAVLRERVPPSESLASVSVCAAGGHVVVREERYAYRADNGQLFFDFELDPPSPGTNGSARRGELAEMPVRHEAPAPEPMVERTADDWFDYALSLEEDDPEGAIGAYRRALELRPECAETLINLGRVHAELGQGADAEACFSRALELSPKDATALYNLGVVAQDCGRDDEAIGFYHRALEIEPTFAEAHYNLATIFDRVGEAQAAIRHINEYRKLTR